MKKGGVSGGIVLCMIVFMFVIPTVFAYDVAYIAKTSGNVDQNIVNVFKELNLSVGVVLDKSVRTTDFSKYKLVLISDNILKQTAKYYDISKYKTIIVNRNYGEEFGLTDKDGISQLASNSPLDVIYGNSLIQVYNSAVDKRGIAIPYYYLDKENILEGFQGVAQTYKGGDEILGDVIAVAEPGAKLINGKITKGEICFFGIAKSDYWTPSVKELFKKECAGFVAIDVACRTNEECNDQDTHTYDYCANPGTANSECRHEPIVCLNNLECGTNGFTGNNFCSGNNINRDYISYVCNNPRSVNSSCSFSRAPRLIQQCVDTCSNGQCANIICRNNQQCDDNNSSTLDECLNPGTTASSCRHTPINCASNSDCGFTGFVGNEFCSGRNVLKNFQNATCRNPGQLTSHCIIESNPLTINQCQYSCSNGACIRCNLDLECNDNNVNTIDRCVNPGQLTSRCSNEPTGNINCTSEIGCGADGFTGNLFCQSNNVYQNYRDYSCNFPNTLQSFCSNSVNARLKQVCQYGCSNGVCNGQIICSSNSECGTDGFTGNNFCSGNDVKRNFVTYTCSNAGTTQSSCSNSQSTRLVESCNYGCSNGVCNSQPECSQNSDCDDGIYCNGQEICENNTCESGQQISCSGLDLPAIGKCDNVPDGNPFTFDSANRIFGVCNEESNSCVRGEYNISHELIIGRCGVECIVDANCDRNEYCSSEYKCEEENNNDGSHSGKNLELVSCNPLWKCGDWSECADGIQRRTCEDTNLCEIAFNKPAEAQGCSVQLNSIIESVKVKAGFNYLFWLLIGVGIIFLLIIVVLVMKG
ncbi:MAG: hypothetical protein WC584_02050 [Candidatus Pacearchaeota archaeon]